MASPSHSDCRSRDRQPFSRDLRRLGSDPFDLLVVGGGAVGTAAARDAALRGLRVALIEREDFGAGTVARSTRLIHGGLRYLEQRDFRLVREALRERETLLRTAPHLVHPLSFLTPIYQGDRWRPAMVGAGMLLYDLLSFDKSLPGHRMMTAPEALSLEPGLDPRCLLGAALYYDAQVASPERLCLAMAQSASAAGATCANHVRAARLSSERRNVIGVEAEDRLTGHSLNIRATCTLNATGPWAAELAPSPNGTPRLRRTQGIHIVVPRLTEHAVVLLAQRDGRVFFVIPWLGRTMIGTTDTDFAGDPRDAVASPEDVDYLIRETRRVFPRADLTRIELGFAGVRPLLPGGGESESDLSREHRIVDHADEGRPGLFSVFGGKLTTARDIAEQVVDRIASRLGIDSACRTARLPVCGGALPAPIAEYVARLESECISVGLPAGTGEAWVDAYGSRSPELVQIYRDTKSGGHAAQGDLPSDRRSESLFPADCARFDFGIREEMALTTADLLLRRTLLGYRGALDLNASFEVSARLGRRLGRTPEQIRTDFNDFVRQERLIRIGGENALNPDPTGL